MTTEKTNKNSKADNETPQTDAPHEPEETITLNADDADNNDSTVKLSDLADDDGGTVALADLAEDDDGGTVALSDLADDDDGGTVALTDLETDDGGTVALTDLGNDDDGGTVALSDLADDDDGGTVALADLETDDGGTVALSDLETDDGGTVALSDLAEDDDGGTVALSDLETDDGGTVALADLEADDGGTVAFDEVDDGGTIAFDDGQTAELEAHQTDELGPPPHTLEVPPQTTRPKSSPKKKKPVIISEVKTGRILQDRYHLETVLGKGGFGAAFLAHDQKLRRICVVKQMLVPRGKSASQLAVYQANFERESHMLVQLNHPGHPNIPEIYDYFNDRTGSYLVMKYIEGRGLDTLLEESEGPIPWREAVSYVIAVCDALHYMHTISKEPILHRDIKPANVLLGNDGRVWVVDFGLAEETDADSSSQDASGSIGYTPLEQWMGDANSASDIYAVGVTLHHLVTGVHPMEAFNKKYNVVQIKKLHGKLTPIREIEEALPKELETVIQSAVAEEPADRPTAQQLRKQLKLVTTTTLGAGLFTFRNGETADTELELVKLCEKYRTEAEGYLYQHDFARWFSLIKREELAQHARHAVEQYPDNRHAGLERFLKLVYPWLFWRRLGRAGRKVSKYGAIISAALLLLLMLGVLVSSYTGRWLFQRAISNYPWNFYALSLEEENVFTESYLNENLRLVTEADFDELTIDVRPPDQVRLQGVINQLGFDVALTLLLEDNIPQLYFTHIKEQQLSFPINNLASGINAGIADAFANAPVDVTNLEVREEEIAVKVARSNRVPWLTPTPGPTTTPTPRPTFTPIPTPEGPALIVIYNDLGRSIILEISGETWNIPANGVQVVERSPGVYNFVITYPENGQLAALGSRSWEAKAYRWYINAASLADNSAEESGAVN